MKIIVQSISRDILKAYGDGLLKDVGVTYQYDIDFLMLIDGDVINSNVEVVYEGDMSFDKAEEIISNKFSDRK